MFRRYKVAQAREMTLCLWRKEGLEDVNSTEVSDKYSKIGLGATVGRPWKSFLANIKGSILPSDETIASKKRFLPLAGRMVLPLPHYALLPFRIPRCVWEHVYEYPTVLYTLVTQTSESWD